jgi:membrane protease YdiL (CAAX protease family)
MRDRLEKASSIILLALFIAVWVWACWHLLTSTLRDRPDPKDVDWLVKQTCGAIVFILSGAFVLAAVGFRWSWYVGSFKYRRVARLFGES